MVVSIYGGRAVVVAVLVVTPAVSVLVIGACCFCIAVLLLLLVGVVLVVFVVVVGGGGGGGGSDKMTIRTCRFCQYLRCFCGRSDSALAVHRATGRNIGMYGISSASSADNTGMHHGPTTFDQCKPSR